jgi:L-amino acid N-acyltransferase YncA
MTPRGIFGTMLIRPAVDGDLDAILAIHNDAILHSTALWTDELVDRGDREEWLGARIDAGNAVLVAVENDELAGYAAYAPWRAKYGYRNTVEDSVYIAAPFQGRGIGRSLLVALIEHARAAGHHVMLADIESGNAASIGLHESLGFVEAGRLREIGQKFDRWLDLTILQLDL